MQLFYCFTKKVKHFETPETVVNFFISAVRPYKLRRPSLQIERAPRQ